MAEIPDRRHLKGDLLQRSQRPAILLLGAAVVLLIWGFVASLTAQNPYPSSQDGINSMMLERMHAISERQDALDTMVKYGLSAIMANLGAHLFQIWNMRQGRKDE
jgi:hypothetical protein